MIDALAVGARPGTGSYAVRTSSSLDIQVLRGDASLIDRLSSDWRRNCDQLPESEPCHRPEWFSTYLLSKAPHAVVVLVTVRRAGRLLAVLPLTQERRNFYGLPLNVLRTIGDRVSPCRFDLVVAPNDRLEVIGAIWNELKRMRGWDALEFVDVPEGGALEALMAQARADGNPTASRVSRRTPYMRLPALGEPAGDAVGDSTARFRANLRRRMRNLEKVGPVKLVREERFDPVLLERFFALEASGWKGRGGTAIALRESEREYFTRLAKEAASGGYLTLYALMCGDATIAMHFGLTMNGRYEVPKLAYDEEWHAYAPGHLLVQEVLRDCIARGLTEFDFLGNDMPWKREWTKTVRVHHRQFVIRTNPTGRSSHWLRFRALPRARRLTRQVVATVATVRVPAVGS